MSKKDLTEAEKIAKKEKKERKEKKKQDKAVVEQQEKSSDNGNEDTPAEKSNDKKEKKDKKDKKDKKRKADKDLDDSVCLLLPFYCTFLKKNILYSLLKNLRKKIAMTLKLVMNSQRSSLKIMICLFRQKDSNQYYHSIN